MPKYRKLPVVVTAELCTQFETIKTRRGDMTACPGDYLVTGLEGERWVCEATTFGLLYEAVDETQSQFSWGCAVCGQKTEGPLKTPYCSNHDEVFGAEWDWCRWYDCFAWAPTGGLCHQHGGKDYQPHGPEESPDGR
jgi:hypothetical protein